MKHTPTPWTLDLAAFEMGGRPLISAGDPTDPEKDITCPKRTADAAFIVRACNAHDELVAALRETERLISECGGRPRAMREAMQAECLRQVRAALAKVAP